MESARVILMENEKLMKEFRDITEHMTGILHIGTSRERAAYMMPRLLPKFAKLYPGIDVQIFTQSGKQLHEALRTGRIDLVLLPQGHETFMEGMVSQQIYTEELLLSAKKGLITEKQRIPGCPHAINPKELNHMPFFMLFQEHAIRNFCDTYFKKIGLSHKLKWNFPVILPVTACHLPDLVWQFCLTLQPG